MECLSTWPGRETLEEERKRCKEEKGRDSVTPYFTPGKTTLHSELIQHNNLYFKRGIIPVSRQGISRQMCRI